MNLGKLGEDSLTQFVGTIKELLLSKNRKFELLAGAGDSGQIMVYIAKIIYEAINIDCPPTIVAPIYRHTDKAETVLFDNALLAGDFRGSIPANASRVLFVDDEIGNGVAAKGMLDLLLALANYSRSKLLTYTIVAEDGGFNSARIQTANVKIEFIPTKKRARTVYNAISYIIPSRYEQPIKSALQIKIANLHCKHSMNVLLHLPTKEFHDGHPKFTFYMHELAAIAIPNLSELQNQFQAYVRDKVYQLLESTEEK